MSVPQGEENLVYNFNFDKLGLEPDEYEQCLTSKVDSLVQAQSEEIKKLAKVSIINVEGEVRVRQIGGKKDSRMDKRLKATQLYIDEGYLKDYNDTFWKHNNRSGGSEENEKKAEKWETEYKENEKTLWETNLLRKIFHQLGRQVGPDAPIVRLCNTIDEVTAHLIGNLSQGVQPNIIEVEEVYELCGRIVRGRTAVDWAIENNLFIDRMDKWQYHVLVIMSYAALMVVADMIHIKLVGRPCARRRAQNIDPSKKAALGSVVLFGTVIFVYIVVRRGFRA